MRFISSAREAPVSAVNVLPVWRRSCTRVPAGRPALAKARAHGLEKLLRRSPAGSPHRRLPNVASSTSALYRNAVASARR